MKKLITAILTAACLLISTKAFAASSVTVTAGSLYVHQNASFGSKVVGVAHSGNTFVVYEAKNGLYRIGTGRWISANSKYVSAKGTGAATAAKTNPGLSSIADKIENIAKKYIGTPYHWGGTEPGGFDCSGFTQYVFKQSGISIPRTSFSQYGIGTNVSRNNLQKGDLVFFNTYGPANSVSHVGIYLENNQFIDAQDNGVKIDNLSFSYWSQRYIGAKRIL